MREITNKAVSGKLLGTYPQRQHGLSMQRIPIPGGRLTPNQLTRLAEVALRYTGGMALHLTTRQSIELHNVADADALTILEELAAAGLPTFGAGGDNVRTITVCPCCAFNPDAFDVQPLAAAVNAFIAEHRPLYHLPRKFKISFSGCPRPQNKPYINDLAFEAISEKVVRVIGAGSLGARPEPGIVLIERLPISDVLAVVTAALEIFDKHGDRENRRQARLRHVRQRLGDIEFSRILNDALLSHRRTGPKLDVTLSRSEGNWQKVGLQTVAGELEPSSALLIAQTARKNNAVIQINLHHGIDLYVKQSLDVPGELTPLLNLPVVTACPGTTTCKNGITNCPAIAAQLAAALKDNGDFKGLNIAISGCPNDCAHSQIADIGLIGRLKTIDGHQQEAYQIYVHGDNGRSRRLSQPIEICLGGDLPSRVAELDRNNPH